MARINDFKNRLSILLDYKNLYQIFATLMILVSNLIQLALKPSGFRQGDSWGYGFSDQRDWHLVSLTGHALRKWPLVLANTILSDTQLQMILQTIFSCCAWIYLIYVISSTYGSRNTAIILIGVLGSLKQIVNWNSIQLSESWSISSVILVVALAIAISYKFSTRKVGFLLAFLLIALNTKPSTLFGSILALIVLVSLSVFLKQNIKVYKHKLILFGVLVILIYSILLNINQSTQNLQNEGTGQSYAAAQAVAVISDINPEARRVISKLAQVENISCLEIDKVKSPVALTELMKHKCQKAELWLTDNFANWYIHFLIANPNYSAKLFFTSLSAGNSPYSMYAGNISIVPDPINKIFFGSRNYANRLNQDSAQNIDINGIEINSPIFCWLILALLLFTTMSLRNGGPEFRKRRIRFLAYGFLVLVGIMTILVSAVLIPNEWYRQSIVGQVEIFIGTILLFAEFSFSRQKSVQIL